jgi:acyl dehydratase
VGVSGNGDNPLPHAVAPAQQQNEDGMNRLGSFTITPQESLDFAHASRDFNPLHLDAVAARRTRFGQTLIHGVCGTIKALDLLLEKNRNRSRTAEHQGQIQQARDAGADA